MLTGKQRSYLKKLAQTVQPAVIVGRAGVTDAVMQTIDEYLTANELLKVAIQEGAELETKETANQVAAKSRFRPSHRPAVRALPESKGSGEAEDYTAHARRDVVSRRRLRDRCRIFLLEEGVRDAQDCTEETAQPRYVLD